MRKIDNEEQEVESAADSKIPGQDKAKETGSKAGNAAKEAAKKKAKEAAKKASKKAAKTAAKTAKNAGKYAKIGAFLAANPIVLLVIVAIIAIIVKIIMLIAQVQFFTTMPGLMLSKIKEVGVGLWANFSGFFTGDTTGAGITNEDVVNLAQYIQNMGYDLESSGFGKPVIGPDGDMTGVEDSADGKKYLKTYIATNENAFALSEVSIWGCFCEGTTILNPFINNKDAKYFSTGMINIIDKSLLENNEDFIKINRDNETMIVYQHVISVNMIQPLLNVFKHVKAGANKIPKIQWGDSFSYDLSTWTSRYGKPTELSLALHLSTMMPDLAYEVDTNPNLNTKVNIEMQDINVNYETTVETPSGETIDSYTIVSKFLDECLTSKTTITTKTPKETNTVVDLDANGDPIYEITTINETTTEDTTTAYKDTLNSIREKDQTEGRALNNPDYHYHENEFFRKLVEQMGPLDGIWGLNFNQAASDGNWLEKLGIGLIGLFEKSARTRFTIIRLPNWRR